MGLQKSENTFSGVDYIVFSLFLTISACIGVFFACSGGKQQTTNEFLMGNRSMQLLPVSISILLSFISAIFILGSPAELYLNGTIYLYYPVGIALGCVVASIIFVPLFYPLKLTSAFEYLEKRYNSRAVKILGNVLYLLQGVVYIGIAMFAPATAIEGVTMGQFNKYTALGIIGLVGTLYTMLGGLKAVVWTDVFQGGVMLTAVVAILIQANIEAGGSGEVFFWNNKYGRLVWSEWSLDPTERHTMWGLIVGTSVGWAGAFGVNQASVQRYCSLPTINTAVWSILLNIPGVLMLAWCCSFCGLAIFAYYIKQNCDIYKIGWATKNQIVPYYVMERMNYPGFPGIFIAALVSGALSSISSSLNACSTITWKDILQPFVFRKISDKGATILNKVLVVCFGILGTGVGILASTLGGTVLQASLSFSGAIAGPSLGLFCLGAFFPWANWIGGIVGPIVGIMFTFWISIGAYSVRKQDVELPSNVTGCLVNSTTFENFLPNTTKKFQLVTTMEHNDGVSQVLDTFYSISYLWYSSFGAFITIVFGLLVSLPLEFRKRNHVDPRFLCPIYRKMCCCFSATYRSRTVSGFANEEVHFENKSCNNINDVEEPFFLTKNELDLPMEIPMTTN